MKKNPSLFVLLVFIASLFATAALLLPIGPGFTRTVGSSVETLRAYDFVFANKTQTLTVTGNGAMIASFVLLVIAVTFELFALLMGFSASSKFAGFLAVVGGLCAIVAGVLYLLAKQIIGVTGYNMQWGFFGGAIAGIASGLTGAVAGVLEMAKKQ